MSFTIDDELAQFSVSFMRSVIAWNNAESTARQILVEMGSSGIGLRIEVEHLGSVSLRDALHTLCDLLTDDELAPSATTLSGHVSHFADGMDILRAYRNFYVHSLRFTGKSADEAQTFEGFLHSVEMKGRYAWIQQKLTLSQINDFMVNTLVLEGYGKAIVAAIPSKRGVLSDLAPWRQSPATALASLQRPTWPERLKKNRSYLKERQPQQKSSAE